VGLIVWDDMDISMNIKKYYTRDHCLQSDEGKTYNLNACSRKSKTKTNATVPLWVGTFGNFLSPLQKTGKSIIFPLKIYQTAQQFQPRLLAKWYGWMRLEYIDLYISPIKLSSNLA
jgi:hypothetical protein